MQKNPLGFLITSTAIFVISLIFIGVTKVDFDGNFKLWLLYTVMAMVAELFPVELPQTGAVSVGFAVNYATLLSFGPGASALSAGLAMLIGNVDRPITKKMINFGQIALAAGSASALFHIFWPELRIAILSKEVFAAGLAALMYALVNITLVTWGGALQTGANYIELFFNNFKWAVPNYLSLARFLA